MFEPNQNIIESHLKGIEKDRDHIGMLKKTIIKFNELIKERKELLLDYKNDFKGLI